MFEKLTGNKNAGNFIENNTINLTKLRSYMDSIKLALPSIFKKAENYAEKAGINQDLIEKGKDQATEYQDSLPNLNKDLNNPETLGNLIAEQKPIVPNPLKSMKQLDKAKSTLQDPNEAMNLLDTAKQAVSNFVDSEGNNSDKKNRILGLN